MENLERLKYEGLTDKSDSVLAATVECNTLNKLCLLESYFAQIASPRS